MHAATGEIEFEVDDTDDVDVISIDPESGNIWMYGERRLRLFQPDATLLADYRLDALPDGKPVSLAVDTGGSQVWLAIEASVFRIDMLGNVLDETVYSKNVAAMAMDSARSRVWVAESNNVYAYSFDGRSQRNSARDGRRRECDSCKTSAFYELG